MARRKSQGRCKPKQRAATAADARPESGSVEDSLARPTPKIPVPALKLEILLQVLSYCVDPIKPEFTADEILCTEVALRVPEEASWFATVARTCKAWVEPALQHLYHTLYVHQARITIPLLKRVAHRVRNLVIEHGPPSPVVTRRKGSNIPFDLFTGLSNLVVIGPKHPIAMKHCDVVIRHIHSSPVLQNLTQLNLWFMPKISVLEWAPLVDLLRACTNLRRIYCVFDDAPAPAALRVARPEKLQEFGMNSGGLTDQALASLYASTQLVNLFITGLLTNVDYHLFCRAIKASSHSLRAIHLDGSFMVDPSSLNLPGQALAGALGSCTSLRFLRLGHLFLTYRAMALRDFFKRLAPLPIEMISFTADYFGDMIMSELIDSLHLLPSLSVVIVMLLRVVDTGTDDYAVVTHRLKSEFPNLVIETLGYLTVWPPPFQSLSPETRAIFEFRPYRAAFPPSIPSVSS
jgi:hypothetical protein